MYKGDFFQDWVKGLMSARASTVDELYKSLELPLLQIKKARSETSAKVISRVLLGNCSAATHVQTNIFKCPANVGQLALL